MSLETVRELLAKQRLVEGLVHGQQMPRQAVVEAIVHRQHLAELERLLKKLTAREIGSILEALSSGDAKLLWNSVPADRENEVLWQIAEPLREQIVGVREPISSDCQINAFELVGGRLARVAVSSRKDIEGLKPIWIDLVNAGPEERGYIGQHFGLKLPDPGDTTDLEVTSRFYIEENEEIRLHSNFLLDRDGDSRSVPVAFILHDGVLFSLRNAELPVFRLQRRRARTRPGYVEDCLDMLLDLYGADVEYAADSLEGIYATLSRIGKQVLSETMTDQEAASVLADIAVEENLNGQIRSNILDTQRALAFLIQSKVLNPGQIDDTRQTLKNIDSLSSHTAFLFDKINFLMDATIGFININQNRRVSQLTVFGVVFMPINILAGIGGMSEFSMMTRDVSWPVAYAILIVTMGLVGWGTFVGLKALDNRKARQAARQKLPVTGN